MALMGEEAALGLRLDSSWEELGWVGLAVRDDSSHGDRGSRLNQWPFFSVRTLKSWSFGIGC